MFLKVFGDRNLYDESKKLIMPLESLIAFSVYKTCSPSNVKLILTLHKNVLSEQELTFIDIENNLTFIELNEAPWQVTSCEFPVVIHEDLVITGLCAVSRHICNYRSLPGSDEEHKDGLLGFRHSCLQAPNEASVWTKFCEIDVVKTVKDILTRDKYEEVPVNMIRFENHLNKPIKVHNVYKFARDMKKESLINAINDEPPTVATKDSDSVTRISKNRKWKSNIKKELEKYNNVKIKDLDVYHQFAEGPFFTLADLLLFPNFYVFSKSLGEDNFKSLLPLTYNWFETVKIIPKLKPIIEYLDTIVIKQYQSENISIPQTEDVSLYNNDTKRRHPKNRLYTKEDDIEAALTNINEGMEFLILKNDYEFDTINWATVPDGANPTAGHLPDTRKDRKTQQLENMTLAALNIAKDGDVIVDFCSGSGHLGILLAHLLPKCTIILLENKEQSLLRARNRVLEMGLKNVYSFQCNLDFFMGKFDIGIALHACGIASDLVLDKCLKANAKFVLCPCCYGSLHATDRLVYPRSTTFCSVPIDKYLCIGHAADQTHEDHPLTKRGARCMAIIDSDRGRLAEEYGYSVTLSNLKPLSCTPKNNLLIGVPS